MLKLKSDQHLHDLKEIHKDISRGRAETLLLYADPPQSR